MAEQQKKGQEQDVNQLRKVRREKLADLQANGKDPFVITKYNQTHHSQEIKDHFEELEGKEVSIAGRMMSKRVMGKASFCNVQDLDGNIPVSYTHLDIDKIRGLGLGADDYMTKPFSPSELVARVKAHMARYERLIGSNVEENEVIEIRGLKIDTTARRVWVNGEESSFTTKEFDLLTFLASHPNHVYSKDELFSEIWDMESIGDIATVTVHIKKIREKIEYDTSKPQYIETIWGVGYRFKV